MAIAIDFLDSGPTIPTLLAFALASTLLIIVPGPNVIFIITRGIDQGRAASIASAAGIELGILVHLLLAILGLSALVASSSVVFHTVTYAGAAYLIWMGWRSIRSRPTDIAMTHVTRHKPLHRLVMQGLIVNLFNPKVGLFFLAFLPQFVDAQRGRSTVQILMLGLTFFAIACVSDLVYALMSGTIGNWLEARPAVARHRNRASGVVYIGLGAMAALSGSGVARHS